MERESDLYLEEEVSTKFTEATMLNNIQDDQNNFRPISGITHQTEASNMNDLNYFLDNNNLVTEISESNQSEILVEREKKFARSETDLVFCIGIDGSEHSDFALNLLLKEFLGKNKILVVYVFDSSLEDIVNFRNKKETVINKYTTILFIEEKKNIHLRKNQ